MSCNGNHGYTSVVKQGCLACWSAQDPVKCISSSDTLPYAVGRVHGVLLSSVIVKVLTLLLWRKNPRELPAEEASVGGSSKDEFMKDYRSDGSEAPSAIDARTRVIVR